VSAALTSVTDTVESVNAVIVSTGEDAGRLATTANAVLENVGAVVSDARTLVASVRQGEGTIGQLLTDRGLYDRITGVSREAELTMQRLRQTSERAQTAIEGFTSPTGTGQQITQTLRNTLVQVQEVTSDLAEGTEALKRNFLFRGFFRNRGFFDLDTVSRQAYLSGALEGTDRTALRIWIGADAIFERGADGLDQLTAEGRRRLDSAMADFVRYPRDSPLVVEGYAETSDGPAPYLISDDRAQIVREYLVSRFRRQTTLTGVMPMSDSAPGSPRGDNRWSGVALTLFVRNDALKPAAR
jgi:phospholipid/cholesterol/gamma-HCH transport system substrate-binding protein